MSVYGVQIRNAFELLGDGPLQEAKETVEKTEAKEEPKKEHKGLPEKVPADARKPHDKKGPREGGAPRGRGGRGGAFRGGRGRGGRGGEFRARPDGEARPPRRQFDRHVSGTGRGKEVSKDGAGPANWGTPAEEVAAVQDAVAEQVAEKKEEAAEKKEEVAAEKKEEQEPKEPEDKTKGYDEYLAELKKKADIDAGIQVRKAGEGEDDSEDLVALKKSADDAAAEAKKEAKKRTNAKKAMGLEEFAAPPRASRGGRGGSSARGGRGGRGGAHTTTEQRPVRVHNKPAAKLEMDDKNFPALS